MQPIIKANSTGAMKTTAEDKEPVGADDKDPLFLLCARLPLCMLPFLSATTLIYRIAQVRF